MSRFPRMLFEGRVYHVYNRSARGEAVLEGPWEVRRLVGLIREVKQRDGFAVLAWCVLSNHFHLAIRMGAVPLSRSLRSIQGRFVLACIPAEVRHDREARRKEWADRPRQGARRPHGGRGAA